MTPDESNWNTGCHVIALCLKTPGMRGLLRFRVFTSSQKGNPSCTAKPLQVLKLKGDKEQ